MVSPRAHVSQALKLAGLALRALPETLMSKPGGVLPSGASIVATPRTPLPRLFYANWRPRAR